jgi:phage terminase large subunit-like protein
MSDTAAWDLSCPDWKERLRARRSLLPAMPLNREAGDRAVAVFNKLRLFDVPGTPTMEEAGGEWFREIVRALFGSYDPVRKMRYIRELFLLVSKKQNKTTGGALLMLTALLLNERPRAPMLLTGPVQKTADDAFAAAEGAITLDNVLHKKLHVRDHLKIIVHRDTGAKLKILTFDPDIVTGEKVVAALIDEEHVIGKMARAKKAMVQLRGGMQPFPEAFLAIITTQSDEAPAGVFKEDLDRAREIRDGKRRGRMLPVLYEFPRELQQDPAKPWRDPKLWPMVMPNLGLSIQLDSLVDAFHAEEENGEAALRMWASQHLNIEIGVALIANGWAGAQLWERQGRPGLTLAKILDRSEVVTVGIDGGGLDDMLGLAVIGRERVTEKWLHWARAWIAPIALERRLSEESKYRDFELDGDLIIIAELPGDVMAVAEQVKEIYDTGLLAKVGLDPEKTHKVMYAALIAVGIPDEIIIGIPQSWRLIGAITVTERKLAEGELEHCAQPLMAYAVGNAKVEPRGNAALITKAASGSAKIDPLMATFDAAALMSLNPEGKGSMDDWLKAPVRHQGARTGVAA